MDQSADGVLLLKAKLGFDRLYDGVLPAPVDRSFFDDAQVFDQLIDAVRPRLIIEVGTWLGHSAIHMTRVAAAHRRDLLTICVDSWLGSYEHYLRDDYLEDLALHRGRPTFYDSFLSNVVFNGVSDSILPLSAPSHTGYQILDRLGIKADLIYIDAGHDYADVASDIRDYRQLLSPSGVIFGDDYFFKPLKRAVDDHAREHGLRVASYGPRGRKWVLVSSREQADRLLGDIPLVDLV